MTEEEEKKAKKITFVLKSEDKLLYRKETVLEGYHVDAIKARGLTFYYFFKDLALSLEEKLEKYNKKGAEVMFSMEYDGRVINKSKLDLTGITREDLTRKSGETLMYFFFSGAVDRVIQLINDEHKEHILETVAVEFSGNYNGR